MYLPVPDKKILYLITHMYNRNSNDDLSILRGFLESEALEKEKVSSEEFGKGFNTGVVIYDLEKIRKSLDFAVGIHFLTLSLAALLPPP
jgi:hypothetical protein